MRPGPALPAAGGYALSPIRVELGGYSSYVNNGFGTWSGGQAQLWYRSRFFTPAFTVDRQTRPQGTQWNYAVLLLRELEQIVLHDARI